MATLTEKKIRSLIREVEADSKRLYTVRMAGQIADRDEQLIRDWLKKGVISGMKDTSVYPPQWLLTGKQVVAILLRPRSPKNIRPRTVQDLRQSKVQS